MPVKKKVVLQNSACYNGFSRYEIENCLGHILVCSVAGGGDMAGTVAIGIQDFDKIMGRNCFYIDKTYFIKEW